MEEEERLFLLSFISRHQDLDHKVTILAAIDGCFNAHVKFSEEPPPAVFPAAAKRTPAAHHHTTHTDLLHIACDLFTHLTQRVRALPITDQS